MKEISEQPIEPGKVQPTYAGFVILRINEIWSIWAEGDDVKALVLALRFADTFMVRKIKKRLQDDVEIIRKDLNKAYSSHGTDFFTSQIIRNRNAKKVAARYLGSFLSELSDLLDASGFFEKATTRLKSSDFKKLGDNE